VVSKQILCSPNHSDSTWENLWITVTEGKPFGDLPNPDDRPGFIFAGWYTEKDGGNQILSSTEYTSTLLKDAVIYAHWGITVQFYDSNTVPFHDAPTEIEGQEGCFLEIPQSVLDAFDAEGYEVIGWETGDYLERVPVEGTVTQIRVPSNLSYEDLYLNRVVSLWAIVQEDPSVDFDILGIGELCEKFTNYIVKKAEEFAIDKYHGMSLSERENLTHKYLSKPYDSSIHSESNGNTIKQNSITVDPKNKEKSFLNGQGSEKLKSIEVGESNFNDSGCGVIACYNALVQFDCNPDLKKVIGDFEDNGYLMRVPFHEFIYEIGKYSSLCGPMGGGAVTSFALDVVDWKIGNGGVMRVGGIGCDPHLWSHGQCDPFSGEGQISRSVGNKQLVRCISRYGRSDHRVSHRQGRGCDNKQFQQIGADSHVVECPQCDIAQPDVRGLW